MESYLKGVGSKMVKTIEQNMIVNLVRILINAHTTSGGILCIIAEVT